MQLQEFLKSDAFTSLPENIKENIWYDSSCEGSPNPKYLAQEFIEEPGDIDGLLKIVARGEDGITQLRRVHNFMIPAEFICTPAKLRTIPAMKEFSESYPNIYRTMEIWTWG